MDDGLHPDMPEGTITHLPPNNYSTKLPDSNVTDLYSYVDADWAGNTRTQILLSGMGIFLARAPIACCAKYQPTVTLSSTDIEFVSV